MIVAPPGRLGRGQSRDEPRPSDPNGGDSGARLRSRLGITVGRKCGPSVERNRFKRRVREWFRAHRDELGSPVDIVVIARREAMALSYAQLVARLAILTQTIPSQPAGIKG